MAALSMLVVLAVLATHTSAQSSSEQVWSSTSWVLYGERTPLAGDGNPPALTPIGADQLYSQGSMFRARYLEKSLDSDITYSPIVGIQRYAIDNTQLDIRSNTDSYTFDSALAFMQGLYPPITQAFSNSSGGMEAATLANGSIVNYPLGGYQYPNIRSTSSLDPDSIWVQGHVGCTKYIESLVDSRSDDNVKSVYTNSLNFYRTLYNLMFHEAFPESMVNFYNAYPLYDYASYQYNHNNASQDQISSVDLDMLAELASLDQRDKNANLSASGLTEGDMIRAVSGRTMAARVVALFKENILSSGTANKLNLVFTSLEPFVAFFALATPGPPGSNFNLLPDPGAAMIFELFSIGNIDSSYPSTEDLWVRFLYRNGTGPDAPLIEYPLFGNGPSNSRILFTDFVASMEHISVNTLADWCQMCDSVSLFCLGLEANSGEGTVTPPVGGSDSNAYYTTSALSPAVAGVIGAAVTVAVCGLGVLAAMLLGGFRFHRAGSKQRNSTLGGFRGAEKMASDTDIAYANSGARHERAGSWELRGEGKGGVGPNADPAEAVGPLGATMDATDLARPPRALSPSRFGSTTRIVDDDAISEIGQAPVKPREF
ncbi:histidine phosphatase superfamily [Podospora appendiculata]|uniref:Histidine phosphatase superfamily n=1 Tax=Podospora appendiculata TaxID=314037 RepID=A0AAE0X2V0_9PEZI|nr:histidine phosphatase superfamily [Podospora appendiculata]